MWTTIRHIHKEHLPHTYIVQCIFEHVAIIIARHRIKIKEHAGDTFVVPTTCHTFIHDMMAVVDFGALRCHMRLPITTTELDM